MTVDMETFAGARIENARLDDNVLVLVLEDGRQLRFKDEARECCEQRYMTCGDDLGSFIGALVVGWEVRDAPAADALGDDNDHEVQFLRVRTDLGTIVCETHNVHNGFYGGFNVVVRVVA